MEKLPHSKTTTISKLQQLWRNWKCCILSWSVRPSIRSLTSGRQKRRDVSHGTFGTSICLWSSNRQIDVCVPLKRLQKTRRRRKRRKKRRLMCQFHKPPAEGRWGRVEWRWVEMGSGFFCYKTISMACCRLSEPPSARSEGNSSAERQLSRAPCVKNYVR